jgi:hypothetical protein
MPLQPKPQKPLKQFYRAVIEIGFIIFLFYSNLLMGEFTRSSPQRISLAYAMRDMVTWENFVIANISALIGYVVFEFLRRKL